MPVHLLELPYFHAGLTHIQDEIRKAFVFRLVPIRSCQEQSVVRMMGAGVPNFLPIHHPLIPGQFCLGGGTREVRSTSWFAKQLAPGIFAGQNSPQKFPFLLM